MQEEIPSPHTVEGIFVRARILYTKSTLTVIHEVKPIPYLLMIVAAIAIFFLFAFTRDQSCFFFGLIVSVLLLSTVLGERSYRYEFDKEQQEIRCKWVGFQGIFIDNRKDIIYPYSDLLSIWLYHIRNRGEGTDTFKIKAMLKFGNWLELPHGYKLSESLTAANTYRDFLEISEPVQISE